MKITHVTLLLALFGLTGCEQTILYSGLSETESTEMISVLFQNGIDASKKSGDEALFDVYINEEDQGFASQVLTVNRLPRPAFKNRDEMFKKEGFVSSPLEEKARLNFALSEELAHTLSYIDGVELARVHLSLPKQSHMLNGAATPSASVFIQHRETINLERSRDQIKALVVNGFEGLRPENVAVTYFPIPQVVVLRARNPQLEPPKEAQFKFAKLQMVTGSGLLFLLLVLLVNGLIWYLLVGKPYSNAGRANND